MCRRYKLIESDKQVFQNISGFEAKDFQEDILAGNKGPAILLRNNKIVIEPMTFGIPSFEKPLLNARSETVSEKPSFREAFSKRRCVLPCSGFYETDKYGHEHYFYSKEGMIYLCGIYTGEFFAILTIKPDKIVSFYHPRMPLAIHKKDIKAYLNTDNNILNIWSLDKPVLVSKDTSEQLSLF